VRRAAPSSRRSILATCHGRRRRSPSRRESRQEHPSFASGLDPPAFSTSRGCGGSYRAHSAPRDLMDAAPFTSERFSRKSYRGFQRWCAAERRLQAFSASSRIPCTSPWSWLLISTRRVRLFFGVPIAPRTTGLSLLHLWHDLRLSPLLPSHG
jgi:hypothetical protein